jgi:hypothetical protein
MMLISPSMLEDLTQADIQYSQLTTGTWGQNGKVVVKGGVGLKSVSGYGGVTFAKYLTNKELRVLALSK